MKKCMENFEIVHTIKCTEIEYNTSVNLSCRCPSAEGRGYDVNTLQEDERGLDHTAANGGKPETIECCAL